MERVLNITSQYESGAASPVQRSTLLPATCLQLSPPVVKALKDNGVNTLIDLVRFAEGKSFSTFRYRTEITSSLASFAMASADGETDWPSYWKHRGYIFYHLCADFPELRQLDAASAIQPVNRDTFGNAGAMLERAGYNTLGSLAANLRSGIDDVRGMGPGKLQQFYERLMEIVEELRLHGTIVLAEEADPRKAVNSENVADLPREIRRLSAGVLHLGSKSKWVREAGLLTIGQIADAWPIEHGDVQGLGPTTLALLSERFHALMSSVTPDGQIDWDRYCNECGIPLVPASSEPVTGTGFLDSLGETLAEIADSLPDQVYAEILRSRLSRMPGEQKTLDEIARSTEPAITRERVRQKEQKLLRQLPGGLIWDSYSGLDIHFRPGFAEWWRIAASRFRDAEEVEFDEFVSALAEAWNVDAPSLTRQLPIIMAIVTGEPGMPAGFRAAVNLNPVYYGELSDELVRLPLTRLRLGKHASQLDASGMSTLEDLIGLCRTGGLEKRQTSSTRVAVDHLNLIASCIDSEGQMNWPAYRMTVGLEQLPVSVTSCPEAFAASLPVTVEDLLRRCQITGRAADIFRFRTSLSKKDRPTLAQTAQHLNTFGPSIKREETFFLQRLNDMIVAREYSRLPVWLEESWLRYWRDAEEVFRTTDKDFFAFKSTLMARWGVGESNRAAAILWSVLSGYPNGRPPRTQPDPDETPDSPLGRIKLRGFRMIH